MAVQVHLRLHLFFLSQAMKAKDGVLDKICKMGYDGSLASNIASG